MTQSCFRDMAMQDLVQLRTSTNHSPETQIAVSCWLLFQLPSLHMYMMDLCYLCGYRISWQESRGPSPRAFRLNGTWLVCTFHIHNIDIRGLAILAWSG